MGMTIPSNVMEENGMETVQEFVERKIVRDRLVCLEHIKSIEMVFHIYYHTTSFTLVTT